MSEVKNLQFGLSMLNAMKNNEKIDTINDTVHLTLHNISRVESTLICLICKDSYVQQSQRYVKNTKEMFQNIDFKTDDKDDEAEKLAKDYETLIEKSIFLYDRMTELKPESVGKARTTEEDYKWGIPIEDARYIMPLSCKTNMTITMSTSKFPLFVYLLYYLSDTFSKDTWKLLLDACDNIDENISKYIMRMVKKVGKGARNPVDQYFKNDVSTSYVDKVDVKEQALYDLSLGTLMSSASDPEEAIKEYETDEDKQKLVLRVAGKGHTSILEQARFKSHHSCSLTCLHQLERHRLMEIKPVGFKSLSHLKVKKFMMPKSIANSKFKKEVDELIDEWSNFAEDVYNHNPNSLNSIGCLLNCQVVPFDLVTNVRADVEVMKQRLCLNAQWEIRRLVNQRKEMLLETNLGFIYKKFALPNCKTIGCQEGSYKNIKCKKKDYNGTMFFYKE